MYQIPDILYKEKMPTRAKRIFAQTFAKYHKLNAGDEDIAMRKAREALEEQYVKMDAINSSWIPRKAAFEILKDDLDDEDVKKGSPETIQQKELINLKNEVISESDYTSSDEDDINVNGIKSNTMKKNYKFQKINYSNYPLRRRRYKQQTDQSTSEESSDE
jgi:hypothetical protein